MTGALPLDGGCASAASGWPHTAASATSTVIRSLVDICYRDSISQSVVLPTDDFSDAAPVIDVEPESQIPAQVIADAAAVVPDAIDPIGDCDIRPGPIAIGEARDADSSDRVERAEHLLRDGQADPG